jgi:hypothetical protein
MNDVSSNLANSDPTRVARQLMQKVHNRDGLAEICIGLFLFWFGALLYMKRILPHNSMAFELDITALAFIAPGMCFGLPWIIKSLRGRYLLNRIGYVKSKPPSRWLVYIGIVIAILDLFIFGYAAPHWRCELAAAGIFSGVLTILISRSLRFVVIATFAVVLSLWLTLTNVAQDLGFAILWGALGLLTLTSGTIVLLRFLRQPVESEESAGA